MVERPRFRVAAGILLLASTALGAGDGPVASGEPEGGAETVATMESVSAGQSDFAGNLYRQLAENGGNVFFSPTSVQLALSMTMAGARGETAGQMAAALHLPDDPHAALGELYASWNRFEGPGELAVANRVWVERTFPLKPAYRSIVEAHYGAGFAAADFVGDPGAERRRINGWVEEQTNQRIVELLKPIDITRETTIVLTNAIYFLGHWVVSFDPDETREMPFHRADSRTSPAQMMFHEASHRYGEHDGVQVLELPYEGGRLSMLVLLPAPEAGLEEIEEGLGADGLAAYRAAATEQKVKVYLPKFEIEATYDLIHPLKALGMSLAFELGRADFTGMSDKDQAISVIAHKAFVKVDEKGTEAAAATAVVMVRSAIAEPTPVFRADRPFLFVIWDHATDAPLFVGRLAEP